MPQTAAALALLCDRQSGQRLGVPPQTLTHEQTAIHSPGLPCNDFHPLNPCSYTEQTVTSSVVS